jgi:hypothetical protein
LLRFRQLADPRNDNLYDYCLRKSCWAMKLFEKISHLVQKTPKVEPEIFFSLILDESYVQAGAWVLDEGKKPRILSSTSERAVSPTWDDRIRMADHAIGKLEEETGSNKLSKVVFGLGERFLTKDGDIEKSARGSLKQLTKSLLLKPLGFVPLSTSIAHFLRKSEGIPTSVILIGVTERNFDISIYRVGRLAFSTSVERSESEGEDIENALKACTDADVLPSRILLYGSDDIRIQEVKSVLLRHQWTARANFLHYPKIEIYPFDRMIDTVVEAGASEITHEMVEETSPDSASPIGEKDESSTGEASFTEQKKPIPEEEKDIEKENVTLEEEPHLVKKEEKGITHMAVEQPEAFGFHETAPKDMLDTHAVKKETEREGVETLLEFAEEKKEKDFFDVLPKEEKPTIPFFGMTGGFGGMIRFGGRLLRRTPKKLFGMGILFLAVLGIGFWGVTEYLPRVTVTLGVLPKNISREDTVIMDPLATVIDTEKKIIPAKKLEKVVTGEKTVPATGKKKVGDPAKGTVTVFNKSEGTSYSLKKGTIINTGSLQFTLDSDVSVASAATNLSKDQLIFGKASVTVTASAVGPEGNVEANKDFTFKDYNSGILIARNEQPLAGGTSKEVTVVSRADYDTLLKLLTADLIEKAKAELASSVSGKDRMIDQTVKTAVKEKQYVEEIDQEVKDLHGTLTVSVSAYTYNEEDVKTLLSGVAEQDIPSGYSVNPGRTTVTIGNITVAKDGKMTAKATLSTDAIPTIDATAIKKTIAGKKLTDVEGELKAIPGVASAEFVFRSAWKKDVLPKNPDHVSIIVTTVE